MDIDQANINSFNNQLTDIKNRFSHELYGNLTDYFRRKDNEIIWIKRVSREVQEMVKQAAKKYLIPII